MSKYARLASLFFLGVLTFAFFSLPRTISAMTVVSPSDMSDLTDGGKTPLTPAEQKILDDAAKNAAPGAVERAKAEIKAQQAAAAKAATNQSAYGCTGDTTLGGTITFYMCVTTRFVTVIAIIIIMVVGLLYIISGFKPEMATTAKTILGTTITGLIFMYMISYIVNLMADAKIMSIKPSETTTPASATGAGATERAAAGTRTPTTKP